jgi:hypothetical protein
MLYLGTLKYKLNIFHPQSPLLSAHTNPNIYDWLIKKEDKKQMKPRRFQESSQIFSMCSSSGYSDGKLFFEKLLEFSLTLLEASDFQADGFYFPGWKVMGQLF